MGFGIIWIVLIIGGIIWFTQYNKNSAGQFNFSGKENAFDILDKRYARGEISKEEYDSIRHDLQNKNG